MRITRFVIVVILSIAAIPTALAAEQQLQDVQKIHIDEMGKSDQAGRFRLLLEQELEKAGFAITAAQNADAILSGFIDETLAQGTSIIRATVVLKDRHGNRLWGGDYAPRLTSFASDKLKAHAEDIAKDLKKAKSKKR